jgi:hypothetical protein
MLCADPPTLIDSTGILNTPTLARVLRGTEISLVFIRRVLPKSHDKAHKYSRSGQDIFRDAPTLLRHQLSPLLNRDFADEPLQLV